MTIALSGIVCECETCHFVLREEIELEILKAGFVKTC
jgi:hypothetical protein